MQNRNKSFDRKFPLFQVNFTADTNFSKYEACTTAEDGRLRLHFELRPSHYTRKTAIKTVTCHNTAHELQTPPWVCLTCQNVQSFNHYQQMTNNIRSSLWRSPRASNVATVIIGKQDRQCTHSVTPRRVSETILAVGNQSVLNILCVYMCVWP
jgi:hypothetical protein